MSATFDSLSRKVIPTLEVLSEKLAPSLLGLALKGVGWRTMADKEYRKHFLEDLGSGEKTPWRARILFRTRDNRCMRHIVLEKGRARSGEGPVEDPDATFILRDISSLKKLLFGSPEEAIEMLLRNELTFDGNLAVVARFSYLLEQSRSLKKAETNPEHDHLYRSRPEVGRRPAPMTRCDEVRYLDDPALSDWTLEDFPRLKTFLEAFFRTRPEISTERAGLMTEHFKKHGFETDPEGRPRNPELRQAEAFHTLMSRRKPVIRENDLVAGTTTDKEIGVVIYPDLGGIYIWPELYTMHARKLNPYLIADEDRKRLNEEIFPYWMNRNLKAVAAGNAEDPTCMKLDDRFVLYFQWKAHSLSHTIPDFPTVLSRGLASLAEEAGERERGAGEAERRDVYKSMRLCLEGVMIYARNLSEEAGRQAAMEADPARKSELENLARICAKVPAEPSQTLEEAVNSMWITWVACHMENTNAGLSIGRMDTWLQPYLEADMARCVDDEARQAMIKRAVELVGCFFMRCTDHLPLVADIGNKLFGGSSSDQAITLGGVLENGSNAVCDMTYVLLKVTEMLRLRDPNVNARVHPGVNSKAYLRRLCEVNVLTGSTPSIHNDEAVIAALVNQGFSREDARDWSATGCVEPTSSGRHFGHTNSMMFSLVAPLEMAFYDGYHPTCDEVIGPRTGDPAGFDSFEAFYGAYLDQLRYVTEKAVECNNLFGAAHQFVRPTPFLSTLIQGCMDSGKDVVHGGATYNSSGVALIGLCDVVDSLVAVKRLVYEEKRTDFPTLLDALRKDFDGHELLRARIMNRVPKFGSGDPETIDMAQDLMNRLYDLYRSFPHYRGGHYTTGYWSMSNHVAFGVLSGALPSGRRKNKPFTPGITPAPGVRDTLLQHIQTVAALDPVKMPNNIAFNVKVVPDPKDTPEEALSIMTAYARTYIEAGGMQMQFNVISTETMRDAMEHPEDHRNLMVRISGYNAYFVELNRDLQLELINRAEHTLG